MELHEVYEKRLEALETTATSILNDIIVPGIIPVPYWYLKGQIRFTYGDESEDEEDFVTFCPKNGLIYVSDFLLEKPESFAYLMEEVTNAAYEIKACYTHPENETPQAVESEI